MLIKDFTMYDSGMQFQHVWSWYASRAVLVEQRML